MSTAPDRYRVDVAVESAYLLDHSAPTTDRYVFAYTVTIQNAGSEAVQLLSRHWIITDANGKVQEVQGDGVVGEQPRLAPGEVFRYTSAALINTPVGSMHGSYRMRANDGNEFNAPIAPFGLAVPELIH